MSVIIALDKWECILYLDAHCANFLLLGPKRAVGPAQARNGLDAAMALMCILEELGSLGRAAES